MWGIIPAAGEGNRIQPLAFSKELLPVGSWRHEGIERPRAVSEYLLERMILGGASKLCIVISSAKSDIIRYFGSNYDTASLAYVVQPKPLGLCDAIFRACPLIGTDEHVLVGLPDTIWFPENGFAALPNNDLCFLLFPVEHPEFFDAVLLDDIGRVRGIEVKRPGEASRWIWGGCKMPGSVLQSLRRLWIERDCKDEYSGTLVNAYIEGGAAVWGIKVGQSYEDVGTLAGYRSAMNLLRQRNVAE